jgi:murein DD-endopeptidase MepM/ murein hydrolase activator NlpD
MTIRRLFALLIVVASAARGQAPAGITGLWRGTLGNASGGLRLTVELTRNNDGTLSALLRSLDQGGGPIPVSRAVQTGDSLFLDIAVIGARYAGKLNADQTQIVGMFDQGGQTPLTFSRGSAATTERQVLTKPSPLGLPVDIVAPIQPVVFTGGGNRQVFYELHLTNYAGGDVRLDRVDVLSGSKTLASYDSVAVEHIVKQPRAAADNRIIPPAGAALLFLQLTLDSATAPPQMLHHRLVFSNGTLDGFDVPVSAAKPVIIGAPFRGENWVAANGPGNESGHRRAIIPINGHAFISQRFAIDWVQIDAKEQTFAGDRLDNKSYHAYGTEILAVADGVISSTKDGIPQNVPGADSRALPITLETIAGNHIIEDLGGGRYAMYAHLQPGSLRVKAGQKVKRGDVLGLLGNSGNSTEPHLHFQVMDRPSPLGAEGLPYLIDSYESKDSVSGPWLRRTNQLPMQNDLVRFAPARKKP